MESMAILDLRNKENVPPIFAKQSNPVPASAPSFKKRGKGRRSRRKPLADITNLFPYCVQHGASLSSSSPSLASVPKQSNPRKQTLPVVVGIGSAKPVCSKSLRMGFR